MARLTQVLPVVMALLLFAGSAAAQEWFNGSASPPAWFNWSTWNNSTYGQWYDPNNSNISTPGGLEKFFGILARGGPWSILGADMEVAGWLILFFVVVACLIGRLPMDATIVIIFSFTLVLPAIGLGPVWMWGVSVIAAGYIVAQAINYWTTRGGVS